MKRFRTGITRSGNIPESLATLISTALLLGACSASNSLVSQALTTDSSGSATGVSLSSSAHMSSASIEENNTPDGSEQSAETDSAKPVTDAAPLAGNENSTDELGPDDTVTCNAPAAHILQRTLKLINEARSQPRICGTDSYGATTALSWSTQLLQAAVKHSADMSAHNFFDHTGSDGSSVSMRVDETGYLWRTVGENIAAGQDSASQAVSGWLDSPGHCKNLMNPSFTEVSVSCSENSTADYKQYWTNVLATPR